LAPTLVGLHAPAAPGIFEREPVLGLGFSEAECSTHAVIDTVEGDE
jgi:hypothetical protein